jgi:hypothetical protein
MNGARHSLFRVLLVMPAIPSLLPAGMPSSDNRACGGVPSHASNYGTACRAPGLGVLGLLLLGLRLLRGWRLLWGWGLLRRWQRRWWCLR